LTNCDDDKPVESVVIVLLYGLANDFDLGEMVLVVKCRAENDRRYVEDGLESVKKRMVVVHCVEKLHGIEMEAPRMGDRN
jgi:hypothetical protein